MRSNSSFYFKNDSKTREFFVSQLGEKFHVNQYLRNFAKQTNDGTLNYGDLVEGWLRSKQANQKSN